MAKIKVILNGGLKTCCQSYPTEMIRTALEGWFQEEKSVEVEVIDIQTDEWQEDELLAFAQQYFADQVFPAVYVDEKLMSLGALPDASSLMRMIEQKNQFSISKEDILAAAKKHGLQQEIS